MRNEFLLKIANVLEQTAAYVDAQEAEKQNAVKVARDRSIKELSAKFSQATGEDLPEDVVAKLASSDEDVLTTVSRLVEKTGSPVESLGGSSEKTGSHHPTSKKERAEAAWNNFGSFINS